MEVELATIDPATTTAIATTIAAAIQVATTRKEFGMPTNIASKCTPAH